MSFPSRLSLFLLALSASALAACSLAGDVTPPPGFGTFEPRAEATSPHAVLTRTPAPPPTPVDTSGMSPGFKPAAADGAFIFQDHCAECHGLTGKGDGTRSAILLENRTEPLPDFSSTLLARGTTPNAWFTVITNGRLEKFMPPWADSLSEAERWSLVAYLYTLSTPAEQMTTGAEIYAANCERCHGATGAGDGPDAAELDKSPRNLADLAWTAERRQQDYFDAVTNGVGDQMPAFEKLTDAERWAVADYARAFSYVYLAPGSEMAERQGTVQGVITNGSGGALPAELEVTLHAFDDTTLFTTLTTTTEADGRYTFPAVGYAPGRRFLASTQYAENTYVSEVTSFVIGQSTLDLPMTIYDVTADPAALQVAQLHAFLEFDPTTQSVRVGELFIVSNTGKETFQGADGQGLQFVLPLGATNLQVQDGELGATYTMTADGFADLRAVPPGEEVAQILFAFDLPYTDALQFSQPMPYPVSSVNLLVSDLAIQLSGGTLASQGVQAVQGMQFQNFQGGALQAGEMLQFQLTGQPHPVVAEEDGAAPAVTPTNNLELAVGLGLLAAVFLGIGFWWYRRSQSGSAADQSKGDLLQAIAELDDDYAAGKVAEAEYHQERTWLKEQLRRVW